MDKGTSTKANEIVWIIRRIHSSQNSSNVTLTKDDFAFKNGASLNLPLKTGNIVVNDTTESVITNTAGKKAAITLTTNTKDYYMMTPQTQTVKGGSYEQDLRLREAKVLLEYDRYADFKNREQEDVFGRDITMHTFRYNFKDSNNVTWRFARSYSS